MGQLLLAGDTSEYPFGASSTGIGFDRTAERRAKRHQGPKHQQVQHQRCHKHNQRVLRQHDFSRSRGAEVDRVVLGYIVQRVNRTPNNAATHRC